MERSSVYAEYGPASSTNRYVTTKGVSVQWNWTFEIFILSIKYTINKYIYIYNFYPIINKIVINLLLLK